MALLRYGVVLLLLVTAPASAETAAPLPAAGTAADHEGQPPAVDRAAVAKALLDQGPVGFVPGNIRVAAEAGAKATQALTRLRAATGARAYLVLCARGTDIAPLAVDLADRLALGPRDVLVLSTAQAWAVRAAAADPAALAQLERTAGDTRGGSAFDRLEALLGALPPVLDGAALPPPTAVTATTGAAAPPPAVPTARSETAWLALGFGAGAVATLLALAVGYAIGRRAGRRA